MEDTTPKIESILIEEQTGVFENTPCIFSINIEMLQIEDEETQIDTFFFAQN